MTAKAWAAPATLLALVASACTPARDTGAAGESEPAPVAAIETSAPAVPSYADWVGTWTGPEGLFVTVTDAGGGRYTLEMQSDLDTRATYSGTGTAEGIAFERAGEPKVLRKATGDETGLKWLAGKRDCLMVQDGEGFCRD